MDMEVAERFQRVRLSRLSTDKKTHCENGGWVTASLLKAYTWNSSYCPLMDFSTPLPSARSIKVPHVEQLHSWDCGLACVLMVLKTLGIEGHDLKSLEELCSTSSIWTVDLAHLLRLFDVEVAFLTVTIGANPSFAVETFYKENMEEDGERVNKLFEKAPEVGIQVQWRSISAQELSMLILSGRYLAIALVDKRKLCYPWLEELGLSDCCGMITGYTGHYVVICGYDMELDEFEIRDPASSSENGRISLQALDEARKSFGTDEDLLLISLDNGRKGSRTSPMVPLVPPRNLELE
ncbi:hypothetical protein GOP47_0025812 [Adiantum capillus-veneris]|uniref:Guanylyl cyclase n=1 Tax=Adiantum capillus-veneris TaxID=13818 RepID=A0A9D4U1X4_ADICA|nr:hypothetical protein GOP47_0025812 [Adiantum capillus-veneris]